MMQSSKFKFKLSFSSFRFCRPKRSSSTAAATHCFSPFNPKVVEISYPTTPSPPPTTPNYQPLVTTPVSFEPTDNINNNSGHRKIIKKNDIHINKEKNNENGWFSNSDGETESVTTTGSFDSSKKMESSVALDGGKTMMMEGLTVVKWSEKPYEDFKKSMLEMIWEKEMVEAKDLEQLLQCFLSLNSRHHHADIVAAFTAIWELLFL